MKHDAKGSVRPTVYCFLSIIQCPYFTACGFYFWMYVLCCVLLLEPLLLYVYENLSRCILERPGNTDDDTDRRHGHRVQRQALFCCSHTHTKRTDNVFMTAQRCRPPVFFYPIFGAACFFIAAYRTLRITGEMSNQIADRRRQWPNKNSKNTWNEEKILVCIVFNAVIGHFWGGESSF